MRLTAGFDSDTWFRIVGVVEDVRHIRSSRDPVPEMYRPYAQAAVPTFTIVVRALGDPAALMPAARAGVLALDSGLPIYDVRTMNDRIAASFAQTRGTMLLLLVTACARGSARRGRDLRLDLVLGQPAAAGNRHQTRVGRHACVRLRAVCFAAPSGLTCIGAARGHSARDRRGPADAGLLFDTPATDPATHAMVVCAVLGLALVAGIVPARRAMSVDPMIALRAD